MEQIVVLKLVLCFGLTHGLEGSKAQREESPPRIVHNPSDVVVKVGSPASLSCRAEGWPEPSIEWLRNGQPLGPDIMEPNSQFLVLPEGSLFFLSVGLGRKGQPSHEAVYTCVARNSLGVATSRNASLRIAALRNEFRVQPSNVEVALGEVAIINCSPPIGQPEPNVTWKKDGLLLNSSDEHYTVLNGKLIIAPAQKNDSGVYICIASNTVGIRESQPARLSVLVKPLLVRKPQDVTVQVGETAHFFCEADGEPRPALKWSRQQGALPNGRYLVNPDSSLQIHYVTIQDSGLYTCNASNDVGVSTASAVLYVEDTSNARQRDLHKELSSLRVELQSVTAMSLASNMTLVQWKLQSMPNKPHYLDGFEVLYRSLLPASSDWVAKKVTLPSLQTQVGPLKRGYKYEFKVRPHGSGLYGRESNTRHLRIPEIAPSAPPMGLSVTMPVDRNDTVLFSWSPPPHDAHNGIIQSYQVWCLQSDDQHFFNWTVDSGTHSLEIGMLHPGKQYWVRVAAINGAGIGVKSDPHRLLIENNQRVASLPSSGTLPQVLAVVQDPVFIGSVGVILWLLLMVAAVCLYRRHTRASSLGHKHHKSSGLYRLASEDLIIKHRMAAPDSPWISGGWRPALCSRPYQDLWAQGQESPSLGKNTLPITARKDPGHLETVVPIVPDSCGVYGTFYMDLSGSKLKTFNSPARRPKMPHYHHHTADTKCETVVIPQPVARNRGVREAQALPWKRPAQPNMGVLKESWEKNTKRELHAVKSAPLVPLSQQALQIGSVTSVNRQRLSHHQPPVLPALPALPPPGGFPDRLRPPGSPRLLHYSASLHLVPPQQSTPSGPRVEDMHSLSSEEGSSKSTKLTMDMGSLQSICTASASAVAMRGASITSPAASSVCPSYPGRTYSRLSTASFCLSGEPSVDDLDLDDATLSTQEATQYLEITPRAERRRILSDNLTPRPFSPTTTFGYICGPSEVEEMGEHGVKQRDAPGGRARLQSTPSSCCSEWEGSLWNAWGSVSEGNMASARTSLISSSDCSFMNDANFARVLALTAESMTGPSLSDFSPPGSPLSMLLPPPRDCFGDLDPLPVWDWSTAWVEEMESQYHVGPTGGAISTAHLPSIPERWAYHHQEAKQAQNKMPLH